MEGPVVGVKVPMWETAKWVIKPNFRRKRERRMYSRDRAVAEGRGKVGIVGALLGMYGVLVMG